VRHGIVTRTLSAIRLAMRHRGGDWQATGMTEAERQAYDQRYADGCRDMWERHRQMCDLLSMAVVLIQTSEDEGLREVGGEWDVRARSALAPARHLLEDVTEMERAL
jgi:hypothetical protein